MARRAGRSICARRAGMSARAHVAAPVLIAKHASWHAVWSEGNPFASFGCMAVCKEREMARERVLRAQGRALCTAEFKGVIQGNRCKRGMSRAVEKMSRGWGHWHLERGVARNGRQKPGLQRTQRERWRKRRILFKRKDIHTGLRSQRKLRVMQQAAAAAAAPAGGWAQRRLKGARQGPEPGPAPACGMPGASAAAPPASGSPSGP